MAELPDELLQRRDRYCRNHARQLQADEPRWWGLEGFLWLTTVDSVLKVHCWPADFRQELAVYQRLEQHGVDRLQGFQVPILLDYDTKSLALELSFVRPPYVVDFAAAGLDAKPADYRPDSRDWIAEKQRVYGNRWPRVVRLLDALRHLGIYYVDVHRRNICFEDPNATNASSPLDSS